MARLSEELVGQLFDCLGDTVYCTKDLQGRYLSINHAFAERLNLEDHAQAIGKKAAALFPAELARVYESQDTQVIESGAPMRDQLELIAHADGTQGWYLSNKFPLLDENQVVSGVVGLSQDLKTPSQSDLELTDLQSVIEYIHLHPEASLKTEDLAQMVGLTVLQLDRRMRKVFRLSTKKFVIKSRLDLAMRLLEKNELSLSEIAIKCGFSDQSSLSRHFKAATNTTPLQYRNTAVS